MTNALILKNESLNKYNSWRVGGAADILFTPQNLEDLKHFLKQEKFSYQSYAVISSRICVYSNENSI